MAEKPTRQRSAPEHYVNNREFSDAVHQYVLSANEAQEKDEEVPMITNYIGECFLKIAERLSHKSNFIQYTYREEMVMDAVENCIKAIGNYNIEAATRTGNPNAFGYFTQICYWAFLRRIAKEKKQHDIRRLYIEHAGVEDLMHESEHSSAALQGAERGFVDVLKQRIDHVHQRDDAIKRLKKKSKTKGGLDEFMK